MEVTDQRTESSLTNSRGPSDPLNNDPMRPERQEGRGRSEVSKYNISLQNLQMTLQSFSKIRWRSGFDKTGRLNSLSRLV